MEREILFKAKRIDNGEWIEGCLYTVKGITEIKGKQIHLNEYYILTPELPYYAGWNLSDTFSYKKVIPETICQYTGLKDKNGKMIFEWDNTKSGYVIMWSNGKALFCEHFQLYDGRWSEASYPIQSERIEITGNIHDNG